MSRETIKCPRCGGKMNHHAEKLVDSSPDDPGYNSVFEGTIQEMYACPNCGANTSRIRLT